MLGERYGWQPEAYSVPDDPLFDWLKDYPHGRSVTELEFYAGALHDVEQCRERSFFFIRDNTFSRLVVAASKQVI